MYLCDLNLPNIVDIQNIAQKFLESYLLAEYRSSFNYHLRYHEINNRDICLRFYIPRDFR